MAERTFTHKPAVLSQVPLAIGLIGPSGGGKTFSALRLATGIQRVSGGEIFVIDTEARRALHYANNFKFQHVDFGAPFCPLQYLAAIEYCARNGAKIVIVDSMSHEHIGPGGVLEQHAQEAERLGKIWKSGADAANFPAWAAPKAKRDRLMNTVTQLGVSAIYCFRAKEKSKPAKRGETVNGEVLTKAAIVELGLMPIGGEELIYEMGCNLILEAGCDGIPTTHSDDIGTRRIIKIPGQFRNILTDKQPLSESTGEALAKWAAGGSTVAAAAPAPQPAKPPGDIEDALVRLENAPPDEIDAIANELRHEYRWTSDQASKIKGVLERLRAPASPMREPNPNDDGRE